MPRPPVCRHCDATIKLINGEWIDDIGVGCAGRGEWGEVLPHEPWERFDFHKSLGTAYGTGRYPEIRRP